MANTATLRKDITQRQLEAFDDAVAELSPDGRLFNVKGIGKARGVLVRSAARAGWFDKDLTDNEIGDMTAGAIARLGQQVDDLYAELTNLPD